MLLMFRTMRRFKQALPLSDCEEILNRGTSGVLAVSGDDGYPYAVPVSYFYDGAKIYFHCAKSGHKLDSIARCDKVSFCVIDQDKIVPEKYTTYFRSVIAFGRAHVVEDNEEKRAALRLLAAKYSPAPELAEGLRKEVDSQLSAVCIVEISIEHLTGKEAIELVRKKEQSA
jgi:nitroimidazol reductase NimA-like FMN-containing flavoprotein (pyridoxamine 5'-phosphate oxidase superfamily)